MNLKNISYRKYQPKDFEKIFKLFVKFQHKAKLSHYETLTKDQGPLFSMPYFVEELKKLLRDHKYHYVGINEDNGKIFGYCCLDDSVIKDGQIDVILVFKDESATYKTLYRDFLMQGIRKEFPNKRIFAVLGKRDKFDKYIRFIKRVVKINVMNVDGFGRVFIEFLE
jgi:hypothetical protein